LHTNGFLPFDQFYQSGNLLFKKRKVLGIGKVSHQPRVEHQPILASAWLKVLRSNYEKQNSTLSRSVDAVSVIWSINENRNSIYTHSGESTYSDEFSCK
jgi:hypothetical protein